MMNDASNVNGWLEVVLRAPNGAFVSRNRYNNVITDAGKAILAKLAAGIAANPFNYIALGTGITAELSTDTALEAEITDTGLARAQDASPTQTTTTVANDTMVINYSWTATGVKAVTEAGLHNASSGVTMLARKTFSAKNTSNGTVVSVTWNVKFG
jgi:hypothetical protein